MCSAVGQRLGNTDAGNPHNHVLSDHYSLGAEGMLQALTFRWIHAGQIVLLWRVLGQDPKAEGAKAEAGSNWILLGSELVGRWGPQASGSVGVVSRCSQHRRAGRQVYRLAGWQAVWQAEIHHNWQNNLALE